MICNEYKMSQFLVKDKEEMNYEDFNARFIRNLQLYGQKYDEDACYDLLVELYEKEPEVYSEWFKTFKKVAYAFIKNNIVLATYLINTNNPELLITAFEMEKKKKSLISRSLPMKSTISTVSENKEKLRLELKKTALLMVSENEDNILRKAEEEFAKYYGEYEDNPYLGDFYTDTLNGIEVEMASVIEREIAKIDGISDYLTLTDQLTSLIEGIQHRKKTKNETVFFKQTFK